MENTTLKTNKGTWSGAQVWLAKVSVSPRHIYRKSIKFKEKSH